MISVGEAGLLFVLPLFLQDAWGLSPVGVGWILMVMAVGALLSGVMAPVLTGLTSPA